MLAPEYRAGNPAISGGRTTYPGSLRIVGDPTMGTLPSTLAAALLGLSLAAQQTYVSPPGYEVLDGDSSSSIPWVQAQARVQQADANAAGIPMVVRAIAFRQDDSASSAVVGQSRVVSVKMAKADVATFTSTFDLNYAAFPVTVISRRTVSLPNWSSPPATSPGSFSLRLPFDMPFAYDGAGAILWELAVENGTTGGTFAQDWVSTEQIVNAPPSTALGTGCNTPSGRMTLTTVFSATATHLVLGFSVMRAPTNAVVVALLGLNDPNFTFPGLCTALRTDAIVSTVLGRADGGGSLLAFDRSVPWQNIYAGAVLLTQTAALDASQRWVPVALSNGRQSPAPLTRGGPAPTGVARTYNTSSFNAMTGVTPSTTAVVTRFEY
jgi:hypothetical protein